MHGLALTSNFRFRGLVLKEKMTRERFWNKHRVIIHQEDRELFYMTIFSYVIKKKEKEDTAVFLNFLNFRCFFL